MKTGRGHGEERGCPGEAGEEPAGSLGAGKHKEVTGRTAQLPFLTLDWDKELPWASRGCGTNPAHGTGKETGLDLPTHFAFQMPF